MAKRVTYLIGAGASANALPVVNGMNERMRIFIDFLKEASFLLKLDESPQYRIDNRTFDKIDNLLSEIKFHYTIDTYAKRLFLLDEYDKLEELKSLLSAYLIFEQLYTDNNFSKNIMGVLLNKYQTKNDSTKLNSLLKIKQKIDYRYDSIFANLLSYETKKINSNINFISWNYDNQFEIAYSNYRQEDYSVDEIQDELQIIPSLKNNIYKKENSAIIKLNGTAGFYDQSQSYSKLFDFSKHSMDEETIKMFIVSLISSRGKFKNNIKFAWEKDEQTSMARQYAKNLFSNTDIIVIIGYSFPTFNREIDRQIFSGFDTRRDNGVRYNSAVEEKRIKKIYIQDKKENALQIKERLKAIGKNLFEVAETYPEVDQFLIPYEL